MSKIFIHIPGLHGSSEVAGYKGWLEADNMVHTLQQSQYRTIAQQHFTV